MKVRLFNCKNLSVFIFRYVIARSISFFSFLFPTKNITIALISLEYSIKNESLRAFLFFFFQFWKEVKIGRVSHHFKNSKSNLSRQEEENVHGYKRNNISPDDPSINFFGFKNFPLNEKKKKRKI